MNLDTIKDYLEAEGYRPKYDEDGDLILKVEGKTIFIDKSSGDEPFIRIMIPNIWEIESEAERLKAYRCASEVTMGIKSAKAYVNTHDNVHIAFESFYPNADAFCEVFPRCLSVTLGAFTDFREAMRKEASAEEEQSSSLPKEI
jgi:hypothetical protein